MALLVQINSNNFADTTYGMQVQTIEHSGTRPGAVASALPEEFNIGYDLGMTLEKITISGICIDGTLTGTSTQNPTKLDLRGAFKSWYSVATDSVLKLTINSNESYYGVVQQYSFRQVEAKETIWEFSFAFAVKEAV